MKPRTKITNISAARPAFALLAFFAVFIFSMPCRATVRNLTEENRKLLADKISQLQKSELIISTRGRMKAKPVHLALFAFYQNLMTNRTLLISRQLDDYRAAILDMEQAREEFRDFESTPIGKAVSAIFDEKLVDAYTLEGKIEKSETIFEVWVEFAKSQNRLQTLPVEFRLAMDAGRWLGRLSGGTPPADILARFLVLCRAEAEPFNILQADTALSDLAGKYSKLFLDAAQAAAGAKK